MRLLVIGGSDAGISAGLAAREHDPTAEVALLLADRYPNFSICGIPYHISGDVPYWRQLAHGGPDDLERAGLTLHLDHHAGAIDPDAHTATAATPDGETAVFDYDRLVIGTGAGPALLPINGLDQLGPANGVHVLHSMGDMFAVLSSLEQRHARTAVIVGAGYIGLEMAEALTARGLTVSLLSAAGGGTGAEAGMAGFLRALEAVVAWRPRRIGVLVVRHGRARMWPGASCSADDRSGPARL